MLQSSELTGIKSDMDRVPAGALPLLLALVREDSQINLKRPIDIWGEEGFVLDVSVFVTNTHRFLSTQNFQ